jgi:hypothetical protein
VCVCVREREGGKEREKEGWRETERQGDQETERERESTGQVHNAIQCVHMLSSVYIRIRVESPMYVYNVLF